MILHIEWCYNSFWKLRYGTKDIYLVYILHNETGDEYIFGILCLKLTLVIIIEGVQRKHVKLCVVQDEECGNCHIFWIPEI